MIVLTRFNASVNLLKKRLQNLSIMRGGVGMSENKCCANCKNFVKYDVTLNGENYKKCGCHYYELSAEISEVDSNKCNCDGGEGWECSGND
jgi:hypothetical protein